MVANRVPLDAIRRAIVNSVDSIQTAGKTLRLPSFAGWRTGNGGFQITKLLKLVSIYQFKANNLGLGGGELVVQTKLHIDR